MCVCCCVCACMLEPNKKVSVIQLYSKIKSLLALLTSFHVKLISFLSAFLQFSLSYTHTHTTAHAHKLLALLFLFLPSFHYLDTFLFIIPNKDKLNPSSKKYMFRNNYKPNVKLLLTGESRKFTTKINVFIETLRIIERKEDDIQTHVIQFKDFLYQPRQVTLPAMTPIVDSLPIIIFFTYILLIVCY